MYSQFKQKEAHPMEKYIGKRVVYLGGTREVVGYALQPGGQFKLIVAGTKVGGWSKLGPYDVVFKECERYWYVNISELID